MRVLFFLGLSSVILLASCGTPKRTAEHLVFPPNNHATSDGSATELTQQLVTELSQASTGSDLFFWGEVHEIQEQTTLLQAFLNSPRALEFATVATEYVTADNEADFQSYLEDSTAVPGSASEKKFFDLLTSEQMIWPRTEDSRNTFRAFWNLKRRNPKVKFCGVDRQYGDRTYNTRVYQSFPKSLQGMVLKASGQKLAQLVNQNVAYLREASMADLIANCVSDGKPALIHVGGYHAMSPARYPERQWQPMTNYLKSLVPHRSMLTFYNSVHSALYTDVINQAFNSWTASTGLKAETLYTALQLSNSPFQGELKADLGDGTPNSLILWDLELFGPLGHDSLIN